MARADGTASQSIEKYVSNLIGTGIKPLCKAKNETFRRAVGPLFQDWTDESDASGLLDFYGQQTQAARAWLEGGECFIRLRPRLASDGLSVPLQIEIVEPELCPHDYHSFSSTKRIRAGIEFDAVGRRVAYYFHPSRPELDDWDSTQLRRVPADLVIHLFEPTRPGQLRGTPMLVQALVKLFELDKLADAQVIRQQLANMFVAYLRRPPGSVDLESPHPLTGLPVSDVEGDRPTLSFEPGIFQELGPGEEMQFSDPPEVPAAYTDFYRQELRSACYAAGVPYEVVTGDLSQVNDRTVRVILHEFRRGVMAKQHQIFAHQFCRRIYRAWMDRAFLSGALPIPIEYVEDPRPWLAVKWMPQGWPYLHPVQDVQAKTAEIRAGLTSRSAAVSEQGEDAEEIDNEQSVDNARADKLGLQYSSDARQPEKAPSTAAPATEREPEGVPA
jgi:lambda family phage portal protein